MRRQREQRLRETLREIRSAIDDFQRDTIAMQCSGAVASVTPTTPQPGQQGAVPPGGGGAAAGGQVVSNIFVDPRSKVMISDCTIFTVENPDHYPPDLKALVNGVSIVPARRECADWRRN
ncbi:MAG: hypothetical protein WKF84_21475 [Pyrinomonadaceae bacterium]